MLIGVLDFFNNGVLLVPFIIFGSFLISFDDLVDNIINK